MTNIEASMILGGVKKILDETENLGNDQLSNNRIIISEALGRAILVLGQRTDSGIVLPS